MSRRSLALVVAAVVVVAGFLAFRPDKLFADDPVDEGLAEAFAPPTTSKTQTTIAEGTMVEPAIATKPVAGTTVTTPVASSPSISTTTAPTTTAVAEPRAISTGALFGIDHSAGGTATIYEQEGSYVLRLEEDTDIQNGPDLYVWLTADSNWNDPGLYLDLGKLKGNVGGQNYPLPAGFDPEVHRNVLIWCLRFAVPFAAAELG